MIEVIGRSTIDRPAADVFEYVADMSNNPEWQKGMESCVWTSDGPIRVGSTYDQVAKFLGREIRTSFEVTEFEPDKLIRIESRSGPMPLDIRRVVTPLGDDRCEVVATIRGDSSGVFRIADPIMKVMVNRSVQADYRRLKARLES